jgi:hypothetical protein
MMISAGGLAEVGGVAMAAPGDHSNRVAVGQQRRARAELFPPFMQFAARNICRAQRLVRFAAARPVGRWRVAT